uniref:LYR motif-containing protein 5 n=1 Tax=Aceria tosichella TaxID=561515 RepID=A0A6G1SR40_9ACAR
MNAAKLLAAKCSIRIPRQLNFVIPRRFAAVNNESGPSVSSNDPENLKHDVIKLYKNLIYLSREWPTDLRPQIKQAFMKNKEVRDPDEIRNLIARGEYVSREIIATYHLRKYRAMKRRYYNEHRDKQMEEMFKNLSH